MNRGDMQAGHSAKTIKAVAFDCDGVMFDSSNANRAYYNHILTHFGLPEITRQQFAYVHMHTVDEAIVYLFEDPRMLSEAQAFRREMSYIPFIRHMEIEPFLVDVLIRLRPQYKTAIATNRTDTMARVLEEHNLRGLFDKVITACDVRFPKPHPDQLLTLLSHFSLDPGEMIFIGDSELDELAAQQAQVPFFAYANPDLKADVYIQNLGEILDFLKI